MSNEKASRLANDHWSYVHDLCKTTLDSALDGFDIIASISKEQLIEVIGFHYKSAFIHGYKHAIEDIESEGRKK